MRPLPPELLQALSDHGRGLSIGIVRLGAFGDILRTLPPVRLLRFHLPDAGLVWICDDRWAPVLSGHRDIDRVIALPRRSTTGDAGVISKWRAALRSFGEFRGEVRRDSLDLVLDFHGNLRSGVVSRLTGAPVRVGFDGHQQKEGNRLWTTHRVPAGLRRRSRMERNLDLIRALGIPDSPLPDAGLPASIGATRTARAIVRDLAGSGVPYAVLNPGASRAQAYKKPPAELLAAAATSLHAAAVTPIVVHGPGEIEDARAVAGLAPQAVRVSPPTDLSTLTAVLRGARVFVGGDSGPLHLACAVGCPVIGLYGPTDPVVNAPWGVRHRTLFPAGRNYTGVKSHDRASGGFEGLRTEQVVTAVAELLAELGDRELETW